MENNDKYVWQEGEVTIAKSQCEFCIYINKENDKVCSEYPEVKPVEVVEKKGVCPKFKSNYNFFDQINKVSTGE